MPMESRLVGQVWLIEMSCGSLLNPFEPPTATMGVRSWNVLKRRADAITYLWDDVG